MFKFVILFAAIAAATASPVATPLIGKLIPQPALAPANTEHAGYVSGLTPVGRQYISYQPVYSALYPATADHIPLAYAHNYVAYSRPIAASSYQIAY